MRWGLPGVGDHGRPLLEDLSWNMPPSPTTAMTPDIRFLTYHLGLQIFFSSFSVNSNRTFEGKTSISVCENGNLKCTGQDPQEQCYPPKIYFNCENAQEREYGAACAPTCQMLATEGQCLTTKCVSGCICPEGLVLDEGKGCVHPDHCSCEYSGVSYKPGEGIAKDCMKCFCAGGKWICHRNALCPSTCTVHGEGHISTFDGKQYVFDGNCEYILVQDACSTIYTQPSFKIVAENVICSSSKTVCTKAIKIYFEKFLIKMTDGTYKVIPENATDEFTVVQNQMYLIFYFGNLESLQLIVTWNLKMNTYIQIAGPSKVSGRPPPLHCLRLWILPPCRSPTPPPLQQATGRPTLVLFLPLELCAFFSCKARKQRAMRVEIECVESGMLYLCDRDPNGSLSCLCNKPKPKKMSQGHFSVCGLCGNANGNIKDELITRSLYSAFTLSSFVNSWKEDPMCDDVTEVVYPCIKNPYRKSWAEKRCKIIDSDVFQPCHKLLYWRPYYDGCVRDACGCELFGDCDCLCDAVAAFAKACLDAGVCIDWRTPDFCPVNCDFYNTHERRTNIYKYAGDIECKWHYQPCLCPNTLWTFSKTNMEGCYNCSIDEFYDPNQKRCVPCKSTTTATSTTASTTTATSATGDFQVFGRPFGDIGLYSSQYIQYI
ncbi:mucin-6-like [Heterodontus francisci]|uniref:mucin-6-like n=1 Tax=Heterodontus francisci TaxID=7792 RepID=UPI00355C9413